MATCAKCGKNILMGGPKIGEFRYCSQQCRFQGFFEKLMLAMEKRAASEPPPAPPPVATGAATDRVPDLLDESNFTSTGEDLKDLTIVLFGLGGLVAAAFLIHVLVELVNYPFHNQTFWFVLPIGAFLCGMVAGLGYWVGLRSMDRLPNKWTYFSAIVGGAGSYVLIYFLMWWFFEAKGQKARDQISFLDFLQVVLEHQRVKFGRGKGEGVELGKWGHARFAINIVGYVLGVLATISIGGGKTYCVKCKRYLKTVGSQVRSSDDPEPTGAALHGVVALLVAGHLQEALDAHAASGEPGAKRFWASTIKVERCPGCEEHQAKLSANVLGERGRQEVEGFVFQGKSPRTVRMPTA